MIFKNPRKIAGLTKKHFNRLLCSTADAEHFEGSTLEKFGFSEFFPSKVWIFSKFFHTWVLWLKRCKMKRSTTFMRNSEVKNFQKCKSPQRRKFLVNFFSKSCYIVETMHKVEKHHLNNAKSNFARPHFSVSWVHRVFRKFLVGEFYD